MEVIIKTKYSIGDEVWCVKDSKIHRVILRSLTVIYTYSDKEEKVRVAYSLFKAGKYFDSMTECDLYDSKEALIASMEA